MSTPRQVLVVGKESSLGAALIARLAARGDQVSATTRRRDGDGLYLDLADSPATWQLPVGLTTAYVCAGITSIQDCETRSEETARINVQGPVELCRRLARSGVFSVVFSSNLVFDGELPRARTDDPVRPQCVYGRQKAALECALRQEGLPCAIVRLTKVLDPAQSLFGHWTELLLSGRPIEAFTDMMMAPVTLAHAVTASLAAGDRRQPGLTHVSAQADISYYQAARRLAERLLADVSLVRAVSATRRTPATVFVPKHTALAPSALSGSLQPDPLAAVDAFAERYHLTGRSHNIKKPLAPCPCPHL